MPSLKRDIDALSSVRFDLCVVGGGITGLCVAHDAASRGLTVALLERDDFAQGTSSASTKLIHGGTRYLEHYEFGLVREALRERRLLLKLAPHLTNPVPFMIPIYDDTPVSASLIRLGMFLYDLLSFDKNWGALADKRFTWHHYLPPSKVLELEPSLRKEGLHGASVYVDGQAPNPMRMCVEFAKTAAANGARLANYARVTGVRVENGRVAGVEVHDRLKDRTFRVDATLTVNCAGIWGEEVMKLLGEPPLHLKPSKGIHLVTRALGRDHALVSVLPTGRRVMVIPWRGKSLVGTTDVFYEGSLDRIRTDEREAQALIDEVNQFMPSAQLTLDDVQATYAGARPLVAVPGKSASDLSRAYKIIDHSDQGKPGMLTVVGGKYTTSRSLAEIIVDRACGILGRHLPCRTAEAVIGGGDVGVVDEYVARQRSVAAGAVDDECLQEMVRSYGSAYSAVLELVKKEPRLGKRIAGDRPFVLAEVRHAVENEMATNVSDIALRRTDLGNLGDRDGKVGQVVADELQAVLGLSDAEKSRQLAEYRDQVALDPAPSK